MIESTALFLALLWLGGFICGFALAKSHPISWMLGWCDGWLSAIHDVRSKRGK